MSIVCLILQTLLPGAVRDVQGDRGARVSVAVFAVTVLFAVAGLAP